jgi:hypothetical protein
MTGSLFSLVYFKAENIFSREQCSAGSNDHFVVGVGVPSLVQFDGRPLGGANFQYYHCTITQFFNATLQHNNHATFNPTIMQPSTQQSRNLAIQQYAIL